MSDLCSQGGGSFASPAELVSQMRKAHRSEDPAEPLAQNPASHAPGVTWALCGRAFPPRNFWRPTRCGPTVARNASAA